MSWPNEHDCKRPAANTVYALDSTTIDLCLSLFPWADFRSTKAAVKKIVRQLSLQVTPIDND
jgi:hypothetical protein